MLYREADVLDTAGGPNGGRQLRDGSEMADRSKDQAVCGRTLRWTHALAMDACRRKTCSKGEGGAKARTETQERGLKARRLCRLLSAVNRA
jgi:hypothetical protein